MGWLGDAANRLLGRGPLIPLQASAGAYYEGASRGPRFATMSAPPSGPNTAILSSGKTLGDRTHALARNEPFIKGGLNTLTIGVVGTGIMPRCELDDMPELQAAAHERWDQFMAEVDADGVTDGYGMQALGVRGAFVGGDTLYRRRNRLATDRAPYMPVPFAVPLQFQVLEGEMLARDKDTPRLANGGKILGGIEYDAIGRKVAYHLYRHHPSERGAYGGIGGGETVAVPADEILHLREIQRPGQVRGEPRCASVILPAHDFHQGEDALQKSWSMQAALSAFIEIADYDVATTDGWLPLLTDAEKQAARAANTGTAAATLEPGDIPVLRPGQKITQATPPKVDSTYGMAQKLRLQRMSAALGMPYELLAHDLERVSYSSARIGLLNFWNECDAFLWHTLVPQVLAPMWVMFFDAAVRAGRLPLSLSDYLKDPRKYLAVSWIQPKRPWVDPLKDVQGEVLAINNNLVSRDDSMLSRGLIPERVDQSIKRSRDRAKSLGIPEPSAVTPAGDRATPPATEDADETDARRAA